MVVVRRPLIPQYHSCYITQLVNFIHLYIVILEILRHI